MYKKIFLCVLKKMDNIFSGQQQVMITEWIRMKITVGTVPSLCVQFPHVQVENRSQIINSRPLLHSCTKKNYLAAFPFYFAKPRSVLIHIEY